jgi:hypothetical protein
MHREPGHRNWPRAAGRPRHPRPIIAVDLLIPQKPTPATARRDGRFVEVSIEASAGSWI